MFDKSMAITLNGTKLLLVEGSSDKAFFDNLLKERNVQGFDVFCPKNADKTLGGEDAIKHLLKALPLSKDFYKIEKIIIVTDADCDSSQKFNKFQQLLNNTDKISGTNDKYPVPTAPYEFATSASNLSVAVMTLPLYESTGAMESICLAAAMPIFPVEMECINNFVSCISAHQWSPQKLAKLKLRSLISTQYKKNPDLPTTYLWIEAPEIVPLESEVFDPLIEYLKQV